MVAGFPYMGVSQVRLALVRFKGCCNDSYSGANKLARFFAE